MNEDLYEFAEQLNIKILSFNLPNCESLSICDGDDYYIGIDDKQIDNSANERVHIAHELGHCETGAFYNEFSPVDTTRKCEEVAERWAIRKLIDKNKFLDMLELGYDIWELAEYFNVTEDYIKKAYKLYFEIKPVM